MKKWIVEALALILSFSSQSALYGAEIPETGKEIVQQAEAAYTRGDYTSFLKGMHEQYQNAGMAGALRGIFESATSAIKITPEQIEAMRDANRYSIQKLNKERNQKLLDAIAETPHSSITERIDNLAFSTPSIEDSKLLAELETLKFHVPETDEESLANILSTLETEYYIKSLLLDTSQHLTKQTIDQTEKRIALALQKLDRMERAAEEKKTPEWVKKIQRARHAFLAERAYRMDLDYLLDLAEGKKAAQNSIEEKVKQIMMEYQQQKQEVLPSEMAFR